MSKRFIICLIFGCSLTTVQADDRQDRYQTRASAEETTGFFGGLLFGGLVGGPPGVVIGGVVGTLLGDGWHAKQRVGDLQADLYRTQVELALSREQSTTLQREQQFARAELDRMKTDSAQLIPATLGQQAALPCCDNTVLSLHFRSGSSVIESHYEEQLAGLVKLAQQTTASHVEITGYADRNGDADRNLALSRQRSDAVKRFLNDRGVRDSFITTVAYGESKPLQSEQNFESDFFDRRVIVRLRDSSSQLLSQTPDGN